MDPILPTSGSTNSSSATRVEPTNSIHPKTKQTAGQGSSASPRPMNRMDDLKRAEQMGEEVTISDKQLVKAIEQAIQSMQGNSTFLQFSVHDETKRIMVKVVNADNNEIIREIPPEHSLDFLAKIWERAGLIIDEKR